MTTDWVLWQLADSAFPAGAFAHSGGLEAAWQHGLLARVDRWEDHLRALLRQAARGAAPFAAAAARDPGSMTSLDDLYDAMLSNHVANRASRAQGQALLAAARRAFAGEALAGVATAARERKCPWHLPVAFGVVAAAVGADPAQAVRLFLFVTLRGFASAAVRLGIVGPLEAQAVQARLAPDAERAAEVALRIDPDDAVQVLPLADLAQGTQDRLYSRLFQS